MTVISTLAGFIPDRVLAGLKAVAVVAVLLGVAWVLVKIEQHGADRVQADWDASKLADQQAIEVQRRDDARINNAASAQHERDRAAAMAALQRNQGAVDAALQRASQCGPTAGDAVVPGELGVHLNAISAAIAPGAASSEPAD